ncbi:Protein X [Frankliniella fusca]|uniref:Protein X n=1 Tax=Frankliniella fusca TaxID=407009 RepID=A0AAE1LMV8_9NEOP|nr:Protein X [Frankliniella fusca]
MCPLPTEAFSRDSHSNMSSTTWTATPREARAVCAMALLCMILPVFSYDGAPVEMEQSFKKCNVREFEAKTVESKVGTPLLSGCPKDLRGLGSPCAVPCTVSGISSRLCRACCIALGLGEEKPSSPVASTATAATTAASSPSSSTAMAQDLQEILALYKAAYCLAPCVRFTAKEIRKAFEDSNRTILDEMKKVLKETNSGQDWEKIIQDAVSGRYLSIIQLCEKKLVIC